MWFAPSVQPAAMNEDEFGYLHIPDRSFIGSENIRSYLDDADETDLADGYLRLLSLGLFERNHLTAAIELLRQAELRNPPSGHESETKLLAILEQLSSSDLQKKYLEIIAQRFGNISPRDLDDEAPIKGEYFFWYAEVERALDNNRVALALYDSALSLPLASAYHAHSLYRKAELEEHILLFEEARLDYERVAHSPGEDPFRFYALIKEASLLRVQSKYAQLQDQFALAKHVLAENSPYIITDIQNSGYVTVFLPLILDPSLLSKRIVGSSERGIANDSSHVLFVPKYPQVYLDILQSSVYSGARSFDSSLLILDHADSVLSAADTTHSNSDVKIQTYLRHLIRFERGWAALSQGDNQKAATIFTALSEDDTTSHTTSHFSRSLFGYTGTFYNDVKPDRSVGASNDSGSGELYDDIPSRAKFYAGIALYRAGKLEHARDILTELSQDESAIYSDKARYHLALVEFESKHTLQAEALLEPVATHRTRAGVYSAILLGDIHYRKGNFARAAEYFGFALANLSSCDTLLAAVSSLERGLSLVALGGWSEAERDLAKFISLSTLRSPGLDEGLFWYGRALLRVDSVEEARYIFKRLLDEYPKSERLIDVEYGYAWSLFRSGHYPEADREFAAVMKLDSITRYAYDALSRRGDAQYAAGALIRSAKIYNLAVDRPTFDDYRTARSMFQLGVIRMRSDSARSAISAFQYIINKLPESDLLDRCLYNIAVCAFAINLDDRANEAVAQLTKKYTSSPYVPKAEYLLADRRERTGDLSGAYQAYRRVTKLYPAAPEFKPSVFGALSSLEGLERYDEAVALADSIYNKYNAAPFASELLYKKGEIEFNAEDPGAAKKTFESFCKKYEHDTLYPMAQLMIARSILADKGSHSDARAILNNIIQKYSHSDAAPFSYLDLARLAKKDSPDEAPMFYRNAFDIQYYSSEAAPRAMYEYAVYLRDGLQNSDSANAVFDELTKRYFIETSIGAKAEMQVVAALLANGERSKAIARLERISAAHTDDNIGASATLDLADQYFQAGSIKKAFDTYEHLRDVYDLGPDELGRAYLGSAHSMLRLAEKKKAVALLHMMRTVRGISVARRAQAEQLLATLLPAKKKRSRK
ncbi:MAG TPA: tetratricopeptide repeat protein [Candidatus Kapabacteria bacterium]|nr:tetratricopeptide repeat protein [Candidatus Kapabacteria bacterium]